MLTKVCRRCKLDKNIEEYYIHKNMADGRLSFCIECTKKRVRKHRFYNDSVREYDIERKTRANRKSLRIKNTKLFREHNPLASAAYNKVARAIKSGALIRPCVCSSCKETKKVHAHHHDYNKPLEVEWVCARCHRREHNAKEF